MSAIAPAASLINVSDASAASAVLALILFKSTVSKFSTQKKKKRKALGVPRDSWVVVTAWGAQYEREKTQRLIICDDGES